MFGASWRKLVCIPAPTVKVGSKAGVCACKVEAVRKSNRNNQGRNCHAAPKILVTPQQRARPLMDDSPLSRIGKVFLDFIGRNGMDENRSVVNYAKIPIHPNLSRNPAIQIPGAVGIHLRGQQFLRDNSVSTEFRCCRNPTTCKPRLKSASTRRKGPR